jgi:hypothetical protein
VDGLPPSVDASDSELGMMAVRVCAGAVGVLIHMQLSTVIPSRAVAIV